MFASFSNHETQQRAEALVSPNVEMRHCNLAAMLKAAQAQSTGASLAPLGRWGDAKSPAMTTSCR
jgi:hypothetical protein